MTIRAYVLTYAHKRTVRAGVYVCLINIDL